MTVDQLADSQIWWVSPPFMSKPKKDRPTGVVTIIEDPLELKRCKLVLATYVGKNEISEKFSN